MRDEYRAEIIYKRSRPPRYYLVDAEKILLSLKFDVNEISALRGRVLVFRLSRIQSVRVLDDVEFSPPPEDYNAEYFRASSFNPIEKM